MLAATFTYRPPITTYFLGAYATAAINEIVEIFAGVFNWLVVLLALGQIFLVRLFAGHSAKLALVCVQFFCFRLVHVVSLSPFKLMSFLALVNRKNYFFLRRGPIGRGPWGGGGVGRLLQ